MYICSAYITLKQGIRWLMMHTSIISTQTRGRTNTIQFFAVCVARRARIRWQHCAVATLILPRCAVLRARSDTQTHTHDTEHTSRTQCFDKWILNESSPPRLALAGRFIDMFLMTGARSHQRLFITRMPYDARVRECVAVFVSNSNLDRSSRRWTERERQWQR